MNGVVELGAVALGFPGVESNVVSELDLVVERGEFVAVLGPSGGGKSTILNAVAGFLRPRAGTVRCCGKEVVAVNRSAGYMTQGDTLLPWKSVRDNVALPLRLRKVARDEVRSRVGNILAMLDLEAAADKYPAQLSGGMKRRALLARSMIYEPEVLLMDEPFGALDAQLRAQLHRELLAAMAQSGSTVLFVTHDVREAVTLSDRVIVIGGSPACVIAEVEIPFGKDRNVDELQYDQRFLDLEREVHERLLLASQLTKSAASSGGSR